MNPNAKQIHDRFFKEAFSRSDVVADFIQAYLPEEFSSQLNPETLVREQDSHIDDELSRHYVDLLFLWSWVADPLRLPCCWNTKAILKNILIFSSISIC